MKISRKLRHEAMLEQGMHSGNTDAKFDPPRDPAQTPFTQQFKKIVKRHANGLAPAPHVPRSADKG